MPSEFDDVEEIVTCSKKLVNRYLQAGYRLLAIEHETSWSDLPKKAGSGGYVRKWLSFALGRPKGIEHFDPLKKPKTTEATGKQRSQNLAAADEPAGRPTTECDLE